MSCCNDNGIKMYNQEIREGDVRLTVKVPSGFILMRDKELHSLWRKEQRLVNLEDERDKLAKKTIFKTALNAIGDNLPPKDRASIDDLLSGLKGSDECAARCIEINRHEIKDLKERFESLIGCMENNRNEIAELHDTSLKDAESIRDLRDNLQQLEDDFNDLKKSVTKRGKR